MKDSGAAVARFVTVGGRGDGAAIAYMLISVLGFSAVPVVVALGGQGAPLMFSAVLKIGSVSGYVLFLLLFYRRLILRRDVWTEILKGMWRSPLEIRGRVFLTAVPFFLATITYFDYAFFSLAVRSVDVSVATVFYEAWPIFLIALIGRLFVREQRYERTSREVFVLSFVGFIGFAFVAASQTGGFHFQVDGPDGESWGLGFGLLAVALFLAPLSAFGLRWGVDLEGV